MSDVISSISSALPIELLAALVLYGAGYITNEIFDRMNGDRKTKLLTRQTEIAFKAIELAEKKYPRKGQGAEKLSFASHYLLANAKIRKYAVAQAFILQCFPLTNYAHD